MSNPEERDSFETAFPRFQEVDEEAPAPRTESEDLKRSNPPVHQLRKGGHGRSVSLVSLPTLSTALGGLPTDFDGMCGLKDYNDKVAAGRDVTVVSCAYG